MLASFLKEREMKKVKVTTPFNFSHDGMQVVRYEAGEQEIHDDAARFAIEQKFGSAVNEPKESIKTVKAK